MELRMRRTRGGANFVANFSVELPEMDILLRNGPVQMQFDFDAEIFEDENADDYDGLDEILDGSGESMADLPSDVEEEDLCQHTGDDYQADGETSIISISSEEEEPTGEEEEEGSFQYTDEHEIDDLISNCSILDVSFEIVVRHEICIDIDSDSNFWSHSNLTSVIDFKQLFVYV